MTVAMLEVTVCPAARAKVALPPTSKEPGPAPTSETEASEMPNEPVFTTMTCSVIVAPASTRDRSCRCRYRSTHRR